MEGSSQPVLTAKSSARLKAFLSDLPASSCAKLLELVERAKLSGEDFPGADTLISQLVVTLTERQKDVPRVGSPARFFFSVFEPFLIEETLPDKRAARIERASLAPIWLWLKRDLLPDEGAAYEKSVGQALLARDTDSARSMTLRFQKLVSPAIRTVLSTRVDEVAQRKLVAQIGGQRIHDDLREMLVILEHRDSLKAMADRIGGPIRQLDEQQTSLITTALAPYARGTAELLPYAVAIVMTKLTQPWQIVRIAVTAAETDQAARIAESSFAPVIELVVVEAERLLMRAETARSNRDIAKLAAATKDFAGHVRALTSDIEMGAELAWGKRVGQLRARMGEVLRPEIDTLPGRVRRLLKISPAHVGGRAQTVDQQEMVAVEAALEIFQLARTFAAELALNEVTLRASSQLQSFLDVGINPLLDSMRIAVGDDRAFRLEQLDAAVKIASRVLGSAYATLLSKAIDVAAGGDRRPAAKSA